MPRAAAAPAANTPLTNGQYEIVASTALRDIYGNALGLTGYQPNGTTYSRTFNVVVPATSGETLVSTLNPAAGGQYTRADSPQSVADDANGDSVVVWTSTTPGQTGVYAKLYQANWTVSATGTRVAGKPTVVPVFNNGTEWPADEILVSSATDADYASVARDATGDFIVTWSQYSATTSWDVYARRYNAAGNPLGAAYEVNSTTSGVQRQSTVAMDNQGDSVIVWQSLPQGAVSYGIYAQRYDPAGNPLGGADNVQELTFTDNPSGTFELYWNGNTTGSISYDGNTAATAVQVQTDLQAIGADVTVTAITGTQILITFGGSQAAAAQPQIGVVDLAITGAAGANITCATTVPGAGGEFLVNTASIYNQVDPDVAMRQQGGFAISWTGFGDSANGDSPNQSNVYASIYDADGTATDAQFLVNKTTAGNQFASAVAADAEGDLWSPGPVTARTAWATGPGPAYGGQNAVYAQVYDASGTVTSAEFPVNCARRQQQPELARGHGFGGRLRDYLGRLRGSHGQQQRCARQLRHLRSALRPRPVSSGSRSTEPTANWAASSR